MPTPILDLRIRQPIPGAKVWTIEHGPSRTRRFYRVAFTDKRLAQSWLLHASNAPRQHWLDMSTADKAFRFMLQAQTPIPTPTASLAVDIGDLI